MYIVTDITTILTTVRIDMLSNIRFLGIKYNNKLNGLNIVNAEILIDTLVPSPVYQSNHNEASPCSQSQRCV